MPHFIYSLLILTAISDNFFSTYRKIFTVVFFANIAVLIALIAKNHGTPSAPDVGSAASANLMVTILFRQENFVNLVRLPSVNSSIFSSHGSARSTKFSAPAHTPHRYGSACA